MLLNDVGKSFQQKYWHSIDFWFILFQFAAPWLSMEQWICFCTRAHTQHLQQWDGGWIKPCYISKVYPIVSIRCTMLQYSCTIYDWSYGECSEVIAFRKHMTSHGPRTLCNGQETPTQWKSKSMTNWRGHVLEMFTHLKKHGFGKCHSLNGYECRYDASYWKAMHALDIQYIPIWGQFPPHIATTDCCHPIQNFQSPFE